MVFVAVGVEVRARFWAEIDAGASVAAASRAAGVTPYSGYEWMRAAGRQLPSGRGQGRPKSAHTRELFWDGLRRGLTVTAAARAAGVSKACGMTWFKQAGGVRPTTIKGQYIRRMAITTTMGPGIRLNVAEAQAMRAA